MTRLTPLMRDRLAYIRENPNAYPCDGNDARTFQALARHGLIQPETFGWSVTDKGAALADELLNGGES